MLFKNDNLRVLWSAYIPKWKPLWKSSATYFLHNGDQITNQHIIKVQKLSILHLLEPNTLPESRSATELKQIESTVQIFRTAAGIIVQKTKFLILPMVKKGSTIFSAVEIFQLQQLSPQPKQVHHTFLTCLHCSVLKLTVLNLHFSICLKDQQSEAVEKIAESYANI